MQTSCFIFLILLTSPLFSIPASGFGSMGPISAAFSSSLTDAVTGFFCAIDASGKQEVICWGKNMSSVLTSFTNIPPMAALSGGEGFLCGILANTSQAYCFSFISIKPGSKFDSDLDLVPLMYKNTAYSHIAAGSNHVCAIRGSYYSDNDSGGSVDCWDIVLKNAGSNDNKIVDKFSSFDQSIGSAVLSKVVSGDGFSCGSVREGGVTCWGPNSASLGVASSGISENYNVLASGKNSLCGISKSSGEVNCWGGGDNSSPSPPLGIRFVSLTAGARHFCGIREDNHGVECWGVFNSSLVPKTRGFMAIASSDFTTCGIREEDLVLDCWFTNVTSPQDYDPPLQLCSPGLCTPTSCGENMFTFNASVLNEPDLTSLCVRKELKVCSPCGINCSQGYFLSSSCTENSDRICTSCSLCQNSSCWDTCGLESYSSNIRQKREHHLQTLILVGGSCGACFLLILTGLCLLPRLVVLSKEKGATKHFTFCTGKTVSDPDIDNTDTHIALSTAPSLESAQIFRLSELKDATNGFKEFNELGRGRYGFVYKAVLTDGRQVAVKRANAATIIHTNTRDFEMELEVLCNVRHGNIVNLLGYCSEMGERLLVYEYMPHGTLHDHLHGGLSPLNWNLRLKITMHAAKGFEYLHKDAVPPIVHRDIKTSNILLDSEWVARIADFGIMGSNDKDFTADIKNDVYDFGVVMLEILSGRKAYDRDYTTPSIIEWALPLIRQGRAAAIIDRYVALPRNVEPLLKLADIAESATREDPAARPTMSDIVVWLEQIVKDGLIF